MPPRRKSSLIVSVFGIVYIKNVLSKFSGFLAALIIEDGILQAHINRKIKNLNLIPLYKFLNTHIDNFALRMA